MVKYLCEKCEYEHYFPSKIINEMGYYICRKCGHKNVIPDKRKKGSKKK